MATQRVARNATFAVSQVIVVSIVLFLLYAFVVKRLGLDSMGVWSVVTAIASVCRLGELGVTGTAVKFVARYSRNSVGEARNVVQTAALTGSAMVGVFALSGSVVFPYILAFFVPDEGLSGALEILPWALLAAWLLVSANILLAVLDGSQRMDIRASINMFGAILLLACAVPLVEAYELSGLVYAQVIQASCLLIISWIFVRRTIPGLPVVPRRWNRDTFRAMFGYGISFQTITAMQMLYEPTTKLLISYYGSLSINGFYEMASRMVLQFRGLFAAGSQVTVPVVASIQEHEAEKSKAIYQTSYSVVFFLAAPLFCLFIAVIPYISDLWLGQVEPVFVYSSVLLAIAWWINALTGPAYFHYLGTGMLRWNVLGHLLIGILNLGFAVMLGEFYGGTGPILAWAASLSIGSMIIPLAYLSESRLGFATMIPEPSRKLLFLSIVLTVLSFLVYDLLLRHTSVTVSLAVTAASYGLILLPIVRKHPVSRQLSAIVRGRDPGKSGRSDEGK